MARKTTKSPAASQSTVTSTDKTAEDTNTQATEMTLAVNEQAGGTDKDTKGDDGANTEVSSPASSGEESDLPDDAPAEENGGDHRATSAVTEASSGSETNPEGDSETAGMTLDALAAHIADTRGDALNETAAAIMTAGQDTITDASVSERGAGFAVRVTGPKKGRRRIGRRFGREPVDVPLEELSSEERNALNDDPALTLEIVPLK